MLMRTVLLTCLIFGFLAAQTARAGIYNTTDTLEETRFSQDFVNVFSRILKDLQLIPIPQPISNPPIRRRYVMIEALGAKGALDLQTLEQKLDYSAVLIRRGKADEAVALLSPLLEDQPKNFVLYTQCATAHFLASNADFKRKSAFLMKQALRRWPQRWDELTEEKIAAIPLLRALRAATDQRP